jgi:hypothetical protein
MQTHLALESFEQARAPSDTDFPKNIEAFSSFFDENVNIDFRYKRIIYTFKKKIQQSILLKIGRKFGNGWVT